MQRMIMPLMVSVFILWTALESAAAEPLSAPTGRVLSEVSGKFERKNRGAEAVLDRPMLEQLGSAKIGTPTSRTDGVVEFEGPLAGDPLAPVGAEGSVVAAGALNDYWADIAITDFFDPGPIAAEISIGFVNPLTGPNASSGGRNRIAVELAAHDLNSRGGVLGHDVRVITVDDACGLERAVTAARELVNAGVPIVVGHFCSHSSLMAAGVYEVADVLMISPSSTHPRLTEEGRRNVFRLIGRDDRQGELGGDLLADHWADRRIAILHDGSTYGEGLAARTRQRLRQRGVTEAIYDAYKPGAKDYSALVVQLQRAGIDALYIGGYGPDAGLILRTARERGDDLRLIGGDGLGMDEFWTIAGPAGEGTIFTGRPDVRGLPEAAAVLAKFRARGLGPRPFGIGAYAAVEVWAQAVERAGSLELAAVARVLRRGRFDTVLGPVTFDDQGDLEGTGWQWQVWANGDYRPLDRDAAPGYLVVSADGLGRPPSARLWN